MVKSIFAARQLLNSFATLTQWATHERRRPCRRFDVDGQFWSMQWANLGRYSNDDDDTRLDLSTASPIPSGLANDVRRAACQLKKATHEFVFGFGFELKLKTKWKLKFVQRVDCLTLSRKFNWVVAAAVIGMTHVCLSSRFSNLPHSKLAG